MEWTCLLVDFANDGRLAESWQSLIEPYDYGMALSYASKDEAVPMLETGTVAMMIVFADRSTSELANLFEYFRKKVGAISTFQGIVCSNPDPFYMAAVYEFGVEQFLDAQTWPADLTVLTKRAAEILSDETSTEFNFIKISRAVALGDQVAIEGAEKSIGETATYDFLAAYAKGNALQAIGKFNEAADSFRESEKLNKTFRPASTGLGENLLVVGRVDEAIAVFEKLEKSNPRDVNRKVNLASAFMEKGDLKKAQELINAAQKLQPDHPRVAEAKAQVLLAQGKVTDAFNMMDHLSEVGPYFAAKLNEMGIKLSQAGKGKSALALYKKAHKIVRAELRYKVSLNAALACYRLLDYPTCLKYLDRCEREFGRKYEKSEKIRAAVKVAMQKAVAAKKVG